MIRMSYLTNREIVFSLPPPGFSVGIGFLRLWVMRDPCQRSYGLNPRLTPSSYGNTNRSARRQAGAGSPSGARVSLNSSSCTLRPPLSHSVTLTLFTANNPRHFPKTSTLQTRTPTHFRRASSATAGLQTEFRIVTVYLLRWNTNEVARLATPRTENPGPWQWAPVTLPTNRD